MGPSSHMLSVVDWNVVMQCMTVFGLKKRRYDPLPPLSCVHQTLFCAFVHVWPCRISFSPMDNSCSAFKSQAKWQLFQEAFPGWPQCEICTPYMFFHNTSCVSVTALIKYCFVNIFMCLTFLWEYQLPESRDSLWLTLVCPLFISQFWHIALRTCFMNQCFKGWHTEED